MPIVYVGENSPGALGLVLVGVEPRRNETVVVKCMSGGTLNYEMSTVSGVSGTLTPSQSQSFTRPVWLSSSGRSEVSVTGGHHGAN